LLEFQGVKDFFVNFRHERIMTARSSLHGVSRGLAVVGLAVGGLLAALMGGPTSGPVAAVFPPWWGGMRAVNAAAEGGAVLRFGLVNFVVLVVPDDRLGRQLLWRAGAWLLLNPRGLSGCALGPGVQSNGGSSATRG
jgi:hypothetical protein